MNLLLIKILVRPIYRALLTQMDALYHQIEAGQTQDALNTVREIKEALEAGKKWLE